MSDLSAENKEWLLRHPPRFQGRAVEIAEPLELKGQWAFEIFMSLMGDGLEPRLLSTGGPFASRDIALAALRAKCQALVEKANSIVDGKPRGDFLDLKTNRIRNYRDDA